MVLLFKLGADYLIPFFRKHFFFFLSFFGGSAPAAYGGSQARGQMEAVAANLHHSHRKARCGLCLQPTPQITATLDP